MWTRPRSATPTMRFNFNFRDSDGCPTSESRLTGLAFGGLVAGFSFYYLFRDVSGLRASAIVAFDGLELGQAHSLWMPGLDSLPSVAHVFVFSLLTASCCPRSQSWSLFACLGWLCVGLTAELLQSSSLPPLARFMAMSGQFDVLDLFGNVLGALAAFAAIRHVGARATKPEEECS
jgi:hypothetical protein